MKLLKQLVNRYNILGIILIFMFLVLSFRLANLTVVRGDELREESDAKRNRELSITAPRGEIRDRYGRLLAGNRPSFTVQVLKDELNNRKLDRNKIILKMIEILESEGESYIDEFPIKFNTIEFSENSEEIYSGKNPEEVFLDRIISNNLVEELLQTFFKYTENQHEYTVLTGEKARLVLKKEGIDVPVKIILSDSDKVEFKFDDSKEIITWKNENNIEDYLSAKSVLVRLISQDENRLRKMLSNSIVRLRAFEILQKHEKTNGLELTPISITFDKEYLSIKRKLISSFMDISMESTAKEDFITIVTTTIAGDLFNSVLLKEEKDNSQKRIIPAQMLIEELEKNNISLPIDIIFDEISDSIEIKYKNDEEKQKFHEANSLRIEYSATEALVYLGKKYELINDIIIDDDVKSFAQKMILEKGINPKISISNWEYVASKNKKDWLGKNGIKSNSSIEEAFESLRKKYKIDEELSNYEARNILVIIEQLNKQGYNAYKPINIAYDIDNKTVALIEENNIDLKGVQVSVEPVRYYPMGESAAHILGHMGKISQAYEIQKYLFKGSEYSLNDIIGKFGLEQRYEEYLNGVDGTKRVEVDVFGNTIRVIEETKAIPGDNLYLTIDAELQRITEEATKHALEEIQKGGEFKSKWGNYNYKESFKNATTGSTVVIDVKTGQVLALANYPAFDPNLFATGISTADYESLKPENEEDLLAPRPLYNVAINTAVQPGSTFKMITGLAGLEKGLDPNTEIKDKGYIVIGDTEFGCWIWNDHRGTHGHENLYEAIRDSCNYYFYTITLGEDKRTGKKIGVDLSIDDICELSKSFGLDDKTGIEIPGERAGSVPNPQVKIEQNKDRLRRYLKNNLINYIKEDINISTKEFEEKIEEISAWVELDETLRRGDVIKRLDKLGFNGLREVDGININLVDMITYTFLKQAGWTEADTLNISIGQGQNAYTPIQMANYIASLSNGGYRHNVSIVQNILDYNDEELILSPERVVERIPLNDYENLEHVKKGMALVTEPGGTASRLFRNFPIKVAAKTGTAQNDGINPVTGEKYDNYAWFVAFAPYDNPQIAIATVIFQGGHGGYAAPISREIIAEYLGLNSTQNETLNFKEKLVK